MHTVGFVAEEGQPLHGTPLPQKKSWKDFFFHADSFLRYPMGSMRHGEEGRLIAIVVPEL